MIELVNVSKTFAVGKQDVHAIRDVSLKIDDGEIYGIIGYSGAGKSTLVRCINLLERPTSGKVLVDGVDVTALSARKLNQARRGMGMIFQQFNLFSTRTVFQNIAYPLRFTGRSKEQIRRRVEELLRFVELEDKRDVYPSQLSGGQKQRVAIARALALEPKVLLCDEATSALDPQTTASILKLLKRLNAETGITLVVITHQMQVVRDICTRVAVMEQGRVVEEGEVYDVFANPRQPVTRSFLSTGTDLDAEQIRRILSSRQLSKDQLVVRLCYQRGNSMEALVSEVSTQFGVKVNIIAGQIELINDIPLGRLTVLLEGKPEAAQAALESMNSHQVKTEVIDIGELA